MTQFIKVIVHPTEADADPTLDFPCLINLRTVRGFFPCKNKPMWTHIQDDDGNYTATHSIEHIMLAIDTLRGQVIDIVQFVADEEAINAVLTPGRNRAIALAKAEELAKNKIN